MKNNELDIKNIIGKSFKTTIANSGYIKIQY